MPPVESILHFPTPDTPDLGCFVRRKHEFETDSEVDFRNVHIEFNPSIQSCLPSDVFQSHVWRGSVLSEVPRFHDD